MRVPPRAKTEGWPRRPAYLIVHEVITLPLEPGSKRMVSQSPLDAMLLAPSPFVSPPMESSRKEVKVDPVHNSLPDTDRAPDCTFTIAPLIVSVLPFGTQMPLFGAAVITNTVWPLPTMGPPLPS